MQKILLSVILELLYRVLRVLERRDGSVAQELQQLPDGACVRIRTSLTPDAPQLTVMHEGGALRRADARLPVSRFCRELDGPHARCIFRPYPGLSMAWRRPCAAGPLRPGRFFFTMRPCD